MSEEVPEEEYTPPVDPSEDQMDWRRKWGSWKEREEARIKNNPSLPPDPPDEDTGEDRDRWDDWRDPFTLDI